MKTLNKTMLFVSLTLYALSTGITAYAEPDAPTKDKDPMGLFGWTHLESENGFHLKFDASGSYGPISGYLQTPLGGTPSSASEKRPKFKELGIGYFSGVWEVTLDRFLRFSISLFSCFIFSEDSF